MNKNLNIYGVDFDGTMTTHEYPAIGTPTKYAIDVLKELQGFGHKIILITMRSGEELEAAVKYFEDASIKLHGVNENPDQHIWTTSKKIYANSYIDDAAVGCPVRLTVLKNGERYRVVDWNMVWFNLTGKTWEQYKGLTE